MAMGGVEGVVYALRLRQGRSTVHQGEEIGFQRKKLTLSMICNTLFYKIRRSFIK